MELGKEYSSASKRYFLLSGKRAAIVKKSVYKIIFYFSVKIDIQHFVYFRYTTQQLDIYITYKMITPINLIPT